MNNKSFVRLHKIASADLSPLIISSLLYHILVWLFIFIFSVAPYGSLEIGLGEKKHTKSTTGSPRSMGKGTDQCLGRNVSEHLYIN